MIQCFQFFLKLKHTDYILVDLPGKNIVFFKIGVYKWFTVV